MSKYLNELYDKYKKQYSIILKKGLQEGKIRIYDVELIEKLRYIYDGGIPASIILLSNELSNGYCYDRSLLLSRAFLDTDDDIKLMYAEVDSIKLNPEAAKLGSMYADHCFLERTTKDGKRYIYDTSRGFIFDEDIYLELEHPVVRKINSKKTIKDFVNKMISEHPNDFIPNPLAATCVLPVIEKSYDNPNEIYTNKGNGLLENEVNIFKKNINYDVICKEYAEEIRRLQLEIDNTIKETDN